MEIKDIREQLAQLNDSAFGWAMVCCGRDREIAVEVLQQAYCRILSGDAVYSGKANFSTWVFGVIRHVAYEELRRCKRDRQHFRSIVHGAASADFVEYGRPESESRESAELLNLALAKLSERQREVLHLTFYEGMTIEEASVVMEITVGSARQHYQRGKAALYRILRCKLGADR